MYVSGYSSQDSYTSPISGVFSEAKNDAQNTTAFLQMFDFFTKKSQTNPPPSNIPRNSEELDLKLLIQVYQAVKEMYYDFDEVDKKDLEYAMISGLVSGL